MTILEECPFCGGDNTQILRDKNGNNFYVKHINRIDKCAIVDSFGAFRSRAYRTEEEAIDAWNRRKYE